MGTVYKYCGAYGIAILKSLELKVTPPNQFNDPFEFTPRMICSDPQKYARRVLKNKANLKKLYAMTVSEGLFTGSFREFREKAELERSEMEKHIALGVPSVVANVQKEHLDHVSAKYGVLCMSERCDSILMWSHYADNHKGIVIGFDDSAKVFRQDKGLLPVNYIKERVVYDANWKPGSVAMTQYETKVVFSKSYDWTYEAELRQLFSLSNLHTKAIGTESKGYFLPFPATAILSVILGLRCPKSTESSIRSLLTQPHLSHIKLSRAVLHDTDFSLKFS